MTNRNKNNQNNKDSLPFFTKNNGKRASVVKKIAKVQKCYQIAASPEKIIAPKSYAADAQGELLEIWQRKKILAVTEKE